MCRPNQLLGFVLVSFGIGLLFGLWIDGGFFVHCIAVGLIVFGLCVSRKK